MVKICLPVLLIGYLYQSKSNDWTTNVFQIPCKHVFCLQCGREEEKACPRCLEPVTRVEQTGLGTVFMCTHGGTRYGHSGCRRTYLSQRDLQVA